MTIINYLRQFRFLEYAIFDFAIVFISIYFSSSYLSKLFLKLKINITTKNWMFLALPISIIVHLISGHITPMTKNFLNPNSHYLLKIIIIFLLFLGLKGIKIDKKK